MKIRDLAEPLHIAEYLNIPELVPMETLKDIDAEIDQLQKERILAPIVEAGVNDFKVVPEEFQRALSAIVKAKQLTAWSKLFSQLTIIEADDFDPNRRITTDYVFGRTYDTNYSNQDVTDHVKSDKAFNSDTYIDSEKTTTTQKYGRNKHDAQGGTNSKTQNYYDRSKKKDAIDTYNFNRRYNMREVILKDILSFITLAVQ